METKKFIEELDRLARRYKKEVERDCGKVVGEIEIFFTEEASFNLIATYVAEDGEKHDMWRDYYVSNVRRNERIIASPDFYELKDEEDEDEDEYMDNDE